jgi:hypothetical protein
VVTFTRLYDTDEGRGIKNVHSVRDVPLRPTCAGFAAFVAARKGPEVFDCPACKSGKVSAFQKRVNGFLRDAGALRKDVSKKFLHSARHYWRTWHARLVCLRTLAVQSQGTGLAETHMTLDMAAAGRSNRVPSGWRRLIRSQASRAHTSHIADRRE